MYGFQEDDVFNARLDQLDRENAVDKLLDHCILVTEVSGDSSDEEDPHGARHPGRIVWDINAMIEKPFKKNKLSMIAASKASTRRFLLTDIMNGGEFAYIASKEFQNDLDKSIRSKGGKQERFRIFIVK
jgi:hypothetical protein